MTRIPCKTCEGPIRETVNMVCQTCGTDYAKPPKAEWASPAHLIESLRLERDAAQAEAAELRDARAVAMADALGVTVTKVAMLP